MQGNFTYKQVVETINKVPGIDKIKVAKDDPELEWPEICKVDNSKDAKGVGD